jgi:aryl-alcohol dehydrogenase-like predicted oxidoreductase
MNYHRLGRTGLRVSAIGLGTVELGLDYGVPVAGEHLRPPEEDAARLLNRALDLGVNFIDTARAYGASEEIIGRALKGRRNEYILATKLAPIRDEGQSDQELGEEVKASVAQSLRMLRTDVIDLLQLHYAPVDVIRSGRVLAAAREAQRAGYLRFIGASTYGEEAPLAALAASRRGSPIGDGYDTLQVAYNLADRTLEEQVLPLAQAQDVGIIVRSVLLRGVLTHRYVLLPDQLAELRSAIAQLSRLADSEGCSLPEVAYRFVLAHPSVATALVGTARTDELEAAQVFASAGPLAPALMAAIRQIAVNDRNQLNPATWPSDMGEWQVPASRSGSN